jgi:hypothetical protein
MEIGPSEPPQHKPMVEESILTMYYAITRVWTKGALLSPRSRWGLMEATVATATTFSPATKEVDRLYHHLEEVYSIATTQLEEDARWHRSNSTPSLPQARTDR